MIPPHRADARDRDVVRRNGRGRRGRDGRSAPWEIRSSVVASQVAIHREWGGVVPELASRQHIRDICGVVGRRWIDAASDWHDLGGDRRHAGSRSGRIAAGRRVVRQVAGRCPLSLPLVPVHHLAGHIESLFLQQRPAAAAGGRAGRVRRAHEPVTWCPSRATYRRIGRTRDDAAGEAYDKVAKLLGLGYPGGPVIDRLARGGDDRAIEFPVARMTHADRNAPYAARATSTSASAGSRRRCCATCAGASRASRLPARGCRRRWPRTGWARPRSPTSAPASSGRSSRRCWSGPSRPRGGTGATQRRDCGRGVGQQPACGRMPPRAAAGSACRSSCRRLALSTDNAAMIAAAGLRRLHAGVTAGWDLECGREP